MIPFMCCSAWNELMKGCKCTLPSSASCVLPKCLFLNFARAKANDCTRLLLNFVMAEANDYSSFTAACHCESMQQTRWIADQTLCSN